MSRRRAGVAQHVEAHEPDQERLVSLIGDVHHGSGPQYRALAEALRAAITSGELPAGARLPPQRELARLLSIARTTVVSACNLLRADSLLVMRQGSGTWVVGRRPPGRRHDPP